MRKTVRMWALSSVVLAACGGDPEYDEETLGGAEGIEQVNQEIQGGTAVSSGQGAVRIRVDGNSGTCSGAIIGRRTVVTAAHCVNGIGYGTNTAQAWVEYWDNDRWWCLTEAATTQARCNEARKGTAWVNPDYRGRGTQNDFAVLTMDRDFSYIRSGHRQYIIENPTKAAIGNFVAIGYGRNFDGDQDPSDPPFRAEFTVSLMKTGYFYSKAGNLLGRAGDTGMRLCSGDSGSPQFEDDRSPFLFGLHVRRAPKNAECGELGVKQYGVLVGPYMAEIEANMGRSCYHFNQVDYGRMADCW